MLKTNVIVFVTHAPRKLNFQCRLQRWKIITFFCPVDSKICCFPTAGAGNKVEIPRCSVVEKVTV